MERDAESTGADEGLPQEATSRRVLAPVSLLCSLPPPDAVVVELSPRCIQAPACD